MPELAKFAKTAKGLAKNPIGIIALFIILIYGFASLIVGMSEHLNQEERFPLILFLVIFPILVLGVFGWLVSRHHAKLYAPTDFRDDEEFRKATQGPFYAAAALGAATAAQSIRDESPEELFMRIRNTANAVIVADPVQSRGEWVGKSILWVDDKHENNRLERRALEEIGFTFVLASSTNEAMDKALESDFGIIITDMSREEDKRAGFILLANLRAQGNRTPVVVYSGDGIQEYVAEAMARGAFGATNRPDELFQLVIAAAKSGIR